MSVSAENWGWSHCGTITCYVIRNDATIRAGLRLQNPEDVHANGTSRRARGCAGTSVLYYETTGTSRKLVLRGPLAGRLLEGRTCRDETPGSGWTSLPLRCLERRRRASKADDGVDKERHCRVRSWACGQCCARAPPAARAGRKPKAIEELADRLYDGPAHKGAGKRTPWSAGTKSGCARDTRGARARPRPMVRSLKTRNP